MMNGNEKEKMKRGLWDWFELLAKFMPAILVAVIAFMGNQFLQNKQKADSNLKLYTQLLANKENSENTLRKDMFSEMLQSFLSPAEGGREDDIGSDEKTIIKIRKDLLSLELLARNFHESLDMKPLFKHVLMEIVRPRIYLNRQDRKLRRKIEASELITRLETVRKDQHAPGTKDEIENAIEKIIEHAYSAMPISQKDNELTEALEALKQKLKNPHTISNESIEIINRLLLEAFYAGELPVSFEKRSLHSDRANPATHAEIIAINASLLAKANIQRQKIGRFLSQHNRELDRLISIAKRVTRKQREVLEDVSGKIRLTIPLQGVASRQVCTSVNPNDISLVTPGMCPNSEELEKGGAGNPILGVAEKGELFYLDSTGRPDNQSKRYFSIKVRYVYPRWKQVYVEIVTGPDKDSYSSWQELSELRRRCETELLNQDNNEGCMNVIYKKLINTHGLKIEESRMTAMTVGAFEQFLKAALEIETSRFWLEYFDFPLVDNSYINSRQRYSVILEGFDPGREGEDESAQITLLYYPASYAGLKEKSFYNNQLMNNLMEQKFFDGSGESVKK